ncbi:MAG: TIGR02921 family PEP-CTERM protein [Phormidesmis sp.]
MKNFIHIISHLVFWVWNLTFIGLVYLWCLPQVGFDLFLAARNGEIEPTFVISLLALLIVPVVSTLLGLFRLRKYPVLLARLFYGVEAPLFTLCFLRLFLIRELTVASGFTLALGVVAIAMFATELLTGYSAYRPRLAVMQMISHSLMLLVGLYAGTLLLLYTLPLLAAVIVGFFDFNWISGFGYFLKDWVRYPFQALAGLLFLMSGAVFLSMPYAFVNFYTQAWARIRSAFGKQHGEARSWAITGSTVALSCLLFVGLQAQPQTKAFNLLNHSEFADTGKVTALSTENLLESRQSQLENADTIKAGLTNAYLHRYRYLSPWDRSNLIRNIYRDTFGLTDEATGLVQNIHNGLLSPFLYRGKAGDAERAATLYAQIFDEPIQKAQRADIRQALQATANRDETSAGVLNLDEEIVYLASQEATVTEQGDWATVEIHEQYQNSTWQDQEIFYSFSLPETATITGLWLGDAESPKLYQYVVSPRGAAQQVYKGEVERGQVQQAVDPALLEQVGPRQYRLRVYPIPTATPVVRDRDGVSREAEDAVEPGPGKLELWMTYAVMQQENGWPLPQLTEKRSIYWTDKTEHLRGQKAVELNEGQWFEAAIPASKAKAKTHLVELGEGYQVTATPLTRQEKKLPTGQKIAVVVDSSYSMGQHTKALTEAVQTLQTAQKENTLDFYTAIASPPASQTLTPARSVDVAKTLFYGSLQPADMLQQFVSAKSTDYDAVLLLTDEGSYELASDQTEIPNIDMPLWIVHVDGKLPSAYTDGLLQRLQATKGGVETDAETALQRMALAAADRVALDGYTWTVENSATGKAAEADAFEAIAARQLIAQQSRTLDTTQVAALDGVHVIAKRTGIVTPYSSMLVLVDERQKQLLKEAEAAEDRFDREVEDGQDNLTEPNNPLTASVPEPGQVLSLMVGAIALVLLKRKSGSSKSPAPSGNP